VHYSTGCIWPETARNIAEVAARIHPDAIVQLGDLSDGVAPIRVTLSYAERVLSDLHRCGAPVYGCVGNHDANYFKGNDELLSAHDCALLYTGRDEPWYYEDFPKAQVRCFFLQSFDPLREQRYGYAAEEVEWLRQELQELPSGWSALCFSHLPLYADIHYWSDSILNEASLSEALECFNRQRPGAILGFIHGHSHVDQVFRKHSFPDISIGCAKFEDFQECKPQGSSTPARRKGDASQDLWNVLIVKRREGRLELVRFGASDDMSIT
jgi:DNA repair exonuclease SbcCD nuclease subunit